MALYFAFGSNMDDEQMARRCPGTTSGGMATLLEHRLVFRGPSKNRGGGVASVDPAPGSEVRGLLWNLSESDILTLDRREGAPHWYKRVIVSVTCRDGSSREAILYRLPGHVLEMVPTDAYYAQIAAACATLELETTSLEDARQRAAAAEAQRSGSQ
jgi:hypothetical protein